MHLENEGAKILILELQAGEKLSVCDCFRVMNVVGLSGCRVVEVRSLQSAVRSRQSAATSRQLAVKQLAVGSPQAAVLSWQSSVGSPQSAVGSNAVGSNAVGSPQSLVLSRQLAEIVL
jgi:hypothetical protein